MKIVFLYLYAQPNIPANQLYGLEHEISVIEVGQPINLEFIARELHLMVLDIAEYTDGIDVLAAAPYSLLESGWDFDLLAEHAAYLVWSTIQDMDAHDD